MKCKACNQETNKETTKIILVFSISNPEGIEIILENNYRKLSIEMCIRNKKQLHELLDKSLDEISNELFVQNTNKSVKNARE